MWKGWIDDDWERLREGEADEMKWGGSENWKEETLTLVWYEAMDPN